MIASIFPFSVALLVSIQTARVAAWDPSTRECGATQIPCLTSFVWCDPQNAHSDCYFPPNAWPLQFPAGNVAYPALFFRSSYNISWKDFDPSYPVRIRWYFDAEGDTESSSVPVQWEYSTISSCLHV